MWNFLEERMCDKQHTSEQTMFIALSFFGHLRY
jgi:hypothetical protein